MFNKRKTDLRNRTQHGQSTVEYILLVTAVLAVIIAFLVSPTGPFQNKVGDTLNVATDSITNMSDRWVNAVGPSTPGGSSGPSDFSIDLKSKACANGIDPVTGACI